MNTPDHPDNADAHLNPPAPAIAAGEFEHFDDALAAALTLIGAARRSLGIVTPNLEPAFYGHPDIVAALKQFARQSREGCARIIVQNPLALRGQAHPLLMLAEKLPSSFKFRAPVEADDMNYASAYLFNDRDGYLFRLAGDRYAGVWSPALPGRARQLADEFERFWQRAQPCAEFAALNI